jgi:hypothetical protein
MTQVEARDRLRPSQENTMRLLTRFAAIVLSLCALGASQLPPDAPGPLAHLVLMHVTGTIVIEPDGHVGGVSFSSDFDPAVRAGLEAKMRDWKFAPIRVGGVARRAETGFEIRLAGEKVGESYVVRLDGTNFDGAAKNAVVPDGVPAPITPRRMAPPSYPEDLMLSGKTGRVRLVIRVSPDGHVEDVVAAQSLAFDFRGREPEISARKSIRVFERNAIIAARRWTFNVPPGTAERGAEAMTVATDVEYVLKYDTGVAGQWVPVQRAPSRAIAWLPRDRAEAAVSGGASAGTVAGLESPYRLETPVYGKVVM